jgi:hypothetical protein
MEESFKVVAVTPTEKEGKYTKFNAILVIISLIGMVVLFIAVVTSNNADNETKEDPLSVLNDKEENSEEINFNNVKGINTSNQKIKQQTNIEQDHGIGNGLTEGGIKETLTNTPTPKPTVTPTNTPTPSTTPSPSPTPTITSTPSVTVTPTLTITPSITSNN